MSIDGYALPVLLVIFAVAAFGVSYFTQSSRPQVRASLSGTGLRDAASAVLVFTWLIVGTTISVGLAGMALGIR